MSTQDDTHQLVAKNGKVSGTVAVKITGWASRREREQAINDALAGALSKASEELGVVLAATPVSYTKERPGRDSQGRMVLEVHGCIEGDVLLPSVRAATKPRG